MTFLKMNEGEEELVQKKDDPLHFIKEPEGHPLAEWSVLAL